MVIQELQSYKLKASAVNLSINANNLKEDMESPLEVKMSLVRILLSLDQLNKNKKDGFCV